MGRFRYRFGPKSPCERRQLRFAAELAEPVVDVLFEQRNGRRQRNVGRLLVALASCANQIGVPEIAADGRRPAARAAR